MADQELLLAISDMMDQKLKSELQPIKEDLRFTKEELKKELNDVKSDLNDVKSDLNDVRSDLNDVRSELNDVRSDLQSTKNEVHQIKLCQENIILPRLNTIESCYTDTYSRYRMYADRMETAFDDIEMLKRVVAEHSEKLQKLA